MKIKNTVKKAFLLTCLSVVVFPSYSFAVVTPGSWADGKCLVGGKDSDNLPICVLVTPLPGKDCSSFEIKGGLLTYDNGGDWGTGGRSFSEVHNMFCDPSGAGVDATGL